MHSNDKANEVSNYVRKNILNKKEEYEIGEFFNIKNSEEIKKLTKSNFQKL